MDIGDLGSIASALVALGALLLSGYLTQRTLKHQRVMQQQELLWGRRADLYVDLISWSHQVGAELKERDQAVDQHGAGDRFIMAMPHDLSARSSRSQVIR